MRINSLKKELEERDDISQINFDGDLDEASNFLIEAHSLNIGAEAQILLEQDYSVSQDRRLKKLKSFGERINGIFNHIQLVFEYTESSTNNRLLEGFAPNNEYGNKLYGTDFWLHIEESQYSTKTKDFTNAKKGWFKVKEDSFLFDGKNHSVGKKPVSLKVYLKVNGVKQNTKPIYTIPGIKLSSSTKNSYYKNLAVGGSFLGLPVFRSKDFSDDNMYKILDFNDIIAYCRTLESCIDYIDTDPSLLYNKKSYYGLEYTIEDFKSLLDTSFLVSHETTLSKIQKRLLCECSIAITEADTNQSSMEKYSQYLFTEYAKSFETKKRISKRFQNVMNNNRFLESFGYVEIDESVDMAKFHTIEEEFVKLKDVLGLQRFLHNDAELRFRRLGKHKANGVYYPGKKCVCIDINTPRSMIHELMHHIDYTTNEGTNISCSDSFKHILARYKNELRYTCQATTNIDVVERFKKKEDYFFAPTEVFARCGEIFLINKGFTTSFLPLENEATLEKGYPQVSEELVNAISNFFEEIFDIEYGKNITTQNNIELEVAVTVETETTPNNRNIFEEILAETLAEDGINQRVRRRRMRQRVSSDESNIQQLTLFS